MIILLQEALACIENQQKYLEDANICTIATQARAKNICLQLSKKIIKLITKRKNKLSIIRSEMLQSINDASSLQPSILPKKLPTFAKNNKETNKKNVVKTEHTNGDSTCDVIQNETVGGFPVREGVIVKAEIPDFDETGFPANGYEHGIPYSSTDDAFEAIEQIQTQLYDKNKLKIHVENEQEAYKKTCAGSPKLIPANHKSKVTDETAVSLAIKLNDGCQDGNLHNIVNNVSQKNNTTMENVNNDFETPIKDERQEDSNLLIILEKNEKHMNKVASDSLEYQTDQTLHVNATKNVKGPKLHKILKRIKPSFKIVNTKEILQNNKTLNVKIPAFKIRSGNQHLTQKTSNIAKAPVFHMINVKGISRNENGLVTQVEVAKMNGINFECTHCKLIFRSQRALTRHTTECHTQHDNFQCQICHKTFAMEPGLEKHMYIKHTRPKTSQSECQICFKLFTHKTSYYRHLKVHTGEKNFECQVCGKRFAHKHNLENHNRIHVGVKAYKCKICNKKFLTDVRLRTHVYIHTGLRPFECKICHKDFYRNYHLKRHLITVHEKSP